MNRFTAFEGSIGKLWAAKLKLLDCQGRVVAPYASPIFTNLRTANGVIDLLFEEALAVRSEVAAHLRGNLSSIASLAQSCSFDYAANGEDWSGPIVFVDVVELTSNVGVFLDLGL